ncbi:MAG: hypothetical protein KAT70_09320, partial [Thermoplasmata archaeon]|nr:hypothetical protein [Thermoplasmata archaeon]
MRHIGSRAFTILLTVLLAMPALVPLLQVGRGDLTVEPDGDWVIDGAGYTYVIDQNTDMGYGAGIVEMTGNLTVQNSATLIIRNATLRFKQDAGPTGNDLEMIVKGSGKLLMDNASLTVQTINPQIWPEHMFNLTVDDAFMEARHSTIEFPGWFNITQDSTVFLNHTTIKNVDGLTSDLLDDAPRIRIADSDVFLADSELSNTAQYDLDTLDSSFVHSYPSTFAGDNTAGGAEADLAEGGNTINVTAGDILSLDAFTIPSVPEGALVSFSAATLETSATFTSPFYTGTANITWAIEGDPWQDSGMNYSASGSTTPADLYAEGLTSLADLQDLNVRFEHNGPAVTTALAPMQVNGSDNTGNTLTSPLWVGGSYYVVEGGEEMVIHTMENATGAFDLSAATLYVTYFNETNYAIDGIMGFADHSSGTPYAGGLTIPSATGINTVSYDLVAGGIDSYA